IMYQIIKCTTSKEAWDTLESLYGKVSEEDVFKIEDELVSLDRSFCLPQILTGLESPNKDSKSPNRDFYVLNVFIDS
ncbi:hypothetical protein P3S38_28330, partial [Enterobacter hormaechei]|uniref:hypothetical protein n=1 Tax=Enterobacter hormaechei TaxID=158836 RepID=UPI0023E38B4B